MILKTFLILAVSAGGWLAVDYLAQPQPPDPPTESPAVPVTERQRQELAGLHSDTVGLFIEGPRFGIERIVPDYRDVTEAHVALGSDEASASIGLEKSRTLTNDPVRSKESHFAFRQAIEGRLGGRSAAGTERWSVRKVQLIGLIKHPRPVAYDTDTVPGMTGIGEVPTRELDPFEERTVGALRSGGAPIAEQRGPEVRAVGPIYAGKQCLSCHERPGELLGAFSYVLERKPADAPKQP